MPWLVQGNCNHCGKCCYNEQLDPEGRLPCTAIVMNAAGTRCKFYEDEVDTGIKYGHCRVMKVSNPKNARDVDGNKITDAELAWYQYNCPQWPMRVKDIQQQVNGNWEVPTTCAFTVIWVD